MFIIISGIDKVGKTTIAREISNTFNIPYIKFAGPLTIKTDDPLIWARDSIIFHESILRLLEKLHEQRIDIVAVLDRFYPDEIAYSKVFRNVNLIESYKDIDRRFAHIGTIMIYMEPPEYSILRERWKKEEKVDIKRIEELIDGFNEFINCTKLVVYKMPQDFAFDKLKNLIKDLAEKAANHEYD